MKPTKPTGMSGLRLRDRILAVVLSLVTAASMVPTRALAEAATEARPASTAEKPTAANAAASASIYSTYLTTSASSTGGTYAYLL